jgi:uncharacterized membrane protein YphA (DoxX/SURF4 family)
VQKHSYTLGVILSLIALRVGIGMHFFREGLNKYRDPQPFSARFFESAKGPLASVFQSRIWDRDGLARLDRAKTLEVWGQYRARVEHHFGFSDDQKKQADRVQKRTEAQLNDHFDVYDSDMEEYLKNVARRDRYESDRQRMETPSLRDQVATIDRELAKKRLELVGPIDLMWEGYMRDLHSVATADQRRAGWVWLDKPGRRLLDSETIDRIIPWFDMTVGVLLITGFLTRAAALAGMAFLGSVMASQWPTSAAALATWPQFIELLGLLVVAAASAGLYAGLDGVWCRLQPRRAAREPRPEQPRPSSPRVAATS